MRMWVVDEREGERKRSLVLETERVACTGVSVCGGTCS